MVNTVLILVALGVIAAVVLWVVAKKFYVYEDPRIDDAETMLPGANCGGCGFPGCRGFAVALVENEDISALFCPVGGASVMSEVATMLGKVAPAKKPQVAVVRCGGVCGKRARINQYDGAQSCAVVGSLYGGETNCSYGCLGKGDCVAVCNFDALVINQETGLAEIDAEKCTGCGACVGVCPKNVIELRNAGVKGRRIYVSCVSGDKGAVTRKACGAGCIGCMKCKKVCPFEAIEMRGTLAYIDFEKCKLCRKCVAECPTGAIIAENFPAPKPVAPKPAAEKPVTEKPVTEKPAVEKPVAEMPAAKLDTPETEQTQTPQ